MDSFQVTSLVLLAIIAVSLIAGVVIMYRSIVRRDEAGKSLQKGVDAVLPRLIEIEALVKGHSPAIERAAGEAAKQLVEVCGLLRTLNQTEGESLAQIRLAATQNEAANELASKFLSLSSELNEIARQIKATALEEVAATNRLINTAQERLTGLGSELQGLRKDLEEVTKF